MKNIAIIAGEFHKKRVEGMVVVAKSVAKKNNLHIEKILWVPGSLEKPLALKRLLLLPKIDGAVVLGIIEKGETKHGMVMGIAVMQAIIALQLETMKPVGVGILGPEITDDQIESRLAPYAKKAVLAVRAMLE